MLKSTDLIPNEFNYREYIDTSKLSKLFNINEKDLPNEITKKITYAPTFSVVKKNKITFPPEFDDLFRLHYIARSRKVTIILEFGLGKSTEVFGNSLYPNKKDFNPFTSKNLRRGNLYECHSIDNYEIWIKECEEKIPKYIFDGGHIHFHLRKLITSEFNNRICTFYEPILNICPDLIYLDGPVQHSAFGDIRFISTKNQDRMPISGDILAIEHFLQPGWLIVIDGRTANARFLANNFQREWAHHYSSEWDQHFFELQESPLDIYNERMIKHCLGEGFFIRISK